MTKFLLGVAVGYICSDVIDELLGRTKTKAEKFMEQTDEKIGTPGQPQNAPRSEQTPPPSPPMS